MSQNMRKLLIVIAVGVSFVLGSRAGRQPYERLADQLRRVQMTPQVKDLLHAVKDEAAERKNALTDKMTSKADDVKSSVAFSSAESASPDLPAAGASV